MAINGSADCSSLPVCDFEYNYKGMDVVSALLGTYCRAPCDSPWDGLDCYRYYAINSNWQFVVDPQRICLPASSSSSSQEIGSSSTSSECSEGNNDFDFENVKNGFRDYYEYFFLLFACFCLIKLLNMAK